jgi:hypothetical protein
MKMTRRRLGAAVLAPAAMLAQAPAPPIPATPEQERAAVKEQNRRNAETLDKFKLPMSTEPAFLFKA